MARLTQPVCSFINRGLYAMGGLDFWCRGQLEKLEFLRACKEIAGKVRAENVGTDKAPYLLGGALEADEAKTLECMEMMRAQASDELLGYSVCPPRGISDYVQMEASLSRMLDKGYPCAVYQLP